MSTRDESWRELIEAEMARHGDALANVVASVPLLESDAMSVPFDTSFGHAQGCPFTLWTKTRVYFPTEYDGAEGVRSASRDPCEEATKHV
jgi:hypothetical protein